MAVLCDYEKYIDKTLQSLEINTEDAFYQKLDELHMEFYDWYSREHQGISFEETKLIREVFQFLKSELGG